MSLIIALAFAFSALASPLSSYEMKSPSSRELFEVSRLFEIQKLGSGNYEAFVPAEEAGTFHLLAPLASLREYDTGAASRQRLKSFQGLTAETGYRSWAEVQAWMKSSVDAHPRLAELVSYGATQESRPLLALRLTNKDSSGPKPAVMITAATHGDELITTEVLMRLVDELFAGYGTEPRLTGFLDKLDIYFIPVVNPDGFAEVERYETGRDPNRSYPYPELPAQKPTPAIGALMRFFLDHEIVGSLDFHAYGELVMYPWAYTHDPVDADSAARFHRLTGLMAEKNQYTFGPIADVIYVAPGSSADYYFWQKHSTSVAVEMGRNKIPRPAQIPAYVESQTESTWRFLEAF